MDEICLVIKAPNQKYEDLKINCELSWTILDLKMYLFNEYPSKPIISDQRLIYSGHLLKDEQCLRDIIQSPGDSSTYTFHLVCPQKQTNKSDQPNNASEAASSTRELPPEAINAFQSFSPNLTNPSSGNPLLSHFGSSNNAVMQESYNTMMNQYYQYMSYYYLSSPPITDYASYYAFANAYMRGVNVNNLASPNLNATNENANNNANGNENQNQPNAAANNRNANNQNNNQADNEEGNRDWTELLYSFSKAMVMLSIMYFYSSFGRLLLLITIALVLYLYKNARLVGVQNILNNNNNEQDNVREQPQMEPANNEANNNENPQSEQQDLPDVGDNNSSNATPENLRYSGLRLVWVFVSSLFTSLIPDPTPIN